MPTYGYKCPGCGHEYEEFQKMNDDTRVNCPKCGKIGERLISGGAGVVFKGSGFYETDYKRAKPETKKDGDSSPKTGDKAKDKPAKPAKDTPKKGDAS